MSPRPRTVKPTTTARAAHGGDPVALRRHRVALATARRMKVRRDVGRSTCLICRKPAHVDGKTGVRLSAPRDRALPPGPYHLACAQRALRAK